MQNVHDTGAYLADQLRCLARQHHCIADVRGKGLFYGLEIVQEPGSTEADSERAGRIAEGMRENGVLLSTFGAYHNVVKIRPPMVFSRENADLLVNSLDKVLSGLQ